MTQLLDTTTRVAQLLAKCYNDPDLFNTAILGRLPYFTYQKAICKSIIKYKVTVIYSGNSVGKDYLVGGVVPWWLLTRKNSLVIITGPSQTTLGSITWKEIRRAVENSRFPLGASLSNGVKASPQTVALNATGWGALGFSTTSIERFSGHHAGQLFCVVEEASGLDGDIWQAIDGFKFTKLLVIGNPIRPDGKFVELIRQAEKDKHDQIPPKEAVNAIQIPSTMSPHADLDESPFGLADRTWLRSMGRQHGVNSLWYRSHILAIIPTVAAESLLKEANLDLCLTNERVFPPMDHRAGVRRISADLAEGVGADASVIFVRDDIGILDCIHGNHIGLAEAATAIAMLAKKWRVDHANIRYDCGGIGSQFVNHLARHGIRTAQEYLGAGSPMSPLYTNIRTEAAFTLRARIDPAWAADPDQPYILQHPFCIPNLSFWPMLREELSTLSFDLVNSKTRLLKKEDHKAKLGRSPDYSDAFLMSWA